MSRYTHMCITMPDFKPITKQREVKALAIVGENQITRVNLTRYKVKSQSSDVWYDVTHSNTGEGWKCSCPDHLFRKIECKHIMSIHISRQLRHKIVGNEDVNEIEHPQDQLMCRCGSCKVKKDGVRKNKSGNIQKYKCLVCGKKWSDNLGFSKNKVNSKIITMAIDLYFKGISLRKIKEHIVMFHGVKVSHVAVLGWIRKFGEVVAPYVDQFVPKEMSGVYHVDEMVVHVRKESIDKGHYQWLWNMMDNTTKFWITSKVTSRREVSNAIEVFQDAKRKSPKPLAVVHDGLQSYNTAFNSEYWTNTAPKVRNVRSVSVRKKGLNQTVERLNGIFRDREVVMRGMDHKESAQRLIEAYRVHYNFVREHGSIKQTPAERAGVNSD